MKAKRSNYAGMIALLLVSAAAVYGIGVYIKKTPESQDVPVSMHRPPKTADTDAKPAGNANSAQGSVSVVTPSSKNGNLSLGQTTEAVPEGTDPIVFSINRFLENSHITPPGARILSVDVKETVAYFSCTEQMDRTYGSADEEALLKGLNKTIAQFQNVKKAIFEVAGKPIETFGNVDIHEGIDITTTPDDSSKPNGA